MTTSFDFAFNMGPHINTNMLNQHTGILWGSVFSLKIYTQNAIDSFEPPLGIHRQSLVKTLNISSNLLSFLIKVPHRNAGNSKRAKVSSSPKGKLGRAHPHNVNLFIIIRISFF